MVKVSTVINIHMKHKEPAREGRPLSYELLGFSEAPWMFFSNNLINSLAAHSEREKKKVAASSFQLVTLRGKRGEAQSAARAKPVLNRWRLCK